MQRQLHGYFAAALGWAVAATWLTTGFVATLVCLAVAAASYGAALLVQGNRSTRSTRSTRATRRPSRSAKPPARRRPDVVLERELAQGDSQPSATGSYGW